MSKIQDFIKMIPDFPKKNIKFRHIGPLLKNKKMLQKAIKSMIDLVDPNLLKTIDVIAGMDARGFIFATALQYEISSECSQVMIRKQSKTPGEKYISACNIEYGTSVFELEVGLIKPGDKVLIVDDLLATGGSMIAAADLITQAGGHPLIFMTLIQLDGLNGMEKIKDIYPDAIIKSLFTYGHDSNSIEPIITHPFANFIQFKPQNYPVSSDMRPILMNHPSMDNMAHRLWLKSNFRRSYINWDYFPDGWPNITFEPSSLLVNRDIVFLMSVAHKEIFAEQMAMLIALPRQLINSLTIIIPYLGPATHERVDYSGMLATVEPILKLISNTVPHTKSGPAVIRIFDIHALQIRFYPSDNITLKLMSATPLVKEWIQNTNPKIKPIICFPDDGAYKRFNHAFGEEYQKIVCAKVRRPGGGRSININNYYGFSNEQLADNVFLSTRDVIIIDDLVQSGGTLIECAKALKLVGFNKISAFVTHAVFPNDSWKRITSDIFHQFIITNTNPGIADKLSGISPFIILPIEPIIITQLSTQFGYNINTHEKKPLYVYVASNNKDKLQAVYDYFNQHFIDIAIVYGVDTISGVPEQPVGYEQTELGALNRFNMLESIIHKHYNYNLTTTNFAIISIENGITKITKKENDQYIDFSVICCKINNMVQTTTPFSMKRVTNIPPEYHEIVKMSLENQAITFGNRMSAIYGIHDWHKFVSGISRKEYLVQNLNNLKLYLDTFFEKYIETEHLVIV